VALESATYISDLVATNPVGATDTKATLDDHIRLVKSTLQATFPNVAGAVTPTHTELNYVDGVTSAIQTQINAKAPTASPTLTGVPVAPTAAVGVATTQIATCEFVDNTAFAVASGLTAASQAEMEAGTEAALRTMSPLRVAQAIDAQTAAVFPVFGDGSDGDVTVNSGTTTLTRNMYYNNLTINGTGSIDAAGYQIFVLGTLDLTAAPAGAIKRTAGAGGNGVTTTAGAAGAAMADTVVVGGAGTGLIGKTGSTGAGVNSTQAVKDAKMHGGLSGATKTAGAATNIAGTGAAKPTAVQSTVAMTPAQYITAGLALAQGGVGGAGGPSGGGSGGGATGGAGGGGGTGGGVVDIRAATISRGASTTASAISVIGGAGGNAGAAGSANSGGGSGGAGGGGGFVQIIYSALSGATATNCIDVSGGAGGNGTAGTGTGTAGQGADGGDGGRVRLINLLAGTITENVSAVTGSANSTLTGGAGAVAKYNL
jgi:hypothetical protein